MNVRIILALLMFIVPASAGTILLLNVGIGVNGATSSYVGPGDIVAGADFWVGLRAYNNAYAVAGSKAAQIRRASDNTTRDINVLNSGAFDITTANAFGGTDATCNAQFNGTTMTLKNVAGTVCTSALHVGDVITGTGIVQPAYITAIGSCGSNSNNNSCTLNAAQATLTTRSVVASVAIFISKLYDQSGNSSDAVQATAANQPQLIPVCINSLPCVNFAGNQSLSMVVPSVGAINQPLTIAGLAQRRGSTIGALIRTDDVVVNSTTWTASANQMNVNAGTSQNFTVSDNSFHGIQIVFNGVSSVFNLDGIDNNTSLGTNGWNSGSNGFIGRVAGATPNFLTGYVNEIGIWPSGFNSGNRANICFNQNGYWSVPASCVTGDCLLISGTTTNCLLSQPGANHPIWVQ